jgi:anti-sigma B factor antagonist
MEFQEEENYGLVIFRVKGKMLGGADANKLNERIHQLLDEKKNRFVLVLGDVDMLTSSGLGILVSALTAVRNENGDVKLAELPEKIRHILEITKLDRVFELYDSTETAVQAFQ